MGSIFTREDLDLARVFIIEMYMVVQPGGAYIVVLVHRVGEILAAGCSDTLLGAAADPLPGILMPGRQNVRTGRSDEFHLRIDRMDGLFKGLIALIEVLKLRLPLLVADADAVHTKGFRMAHGRASGAPGGGHIAVGELDQIQRILDEFLELRRVDGHQFRTLILAGQADRQDRQGLGADGLAQQEIFIVADTVGLAIVGVGTLKGVLPLRLSLMGHAVHGPAVPVVDTMLYRADGLLPLVAVRQVVSFDDAAAGEAHEAGLEFFKFFKKILAEQAQYSVFRHQGEPVEIHMAFMASGP